MNSTPKKWQILLILMIPLLLSLYWACDNTPANATDTSPINSSITLDAQPDYVLGIGRVEPEGKMVDLYPQSDGIITHINIKLGDKVSKDQVLFTIDSKGANEQVAVVKAQIEEQQAIIQGAQIDINKAKINSENAKKTYDRIQSVYDKGAETIHNVNNAESVYRSSLEDIKRLQSNVQFEEARLKELKAVLRSAQSNVGRYSVKAPTNGQILGMEVAIGSSVTPSSKLGTFASDGATVVVTEIDELYASLVNLNQSAFVRQQGSKDTVAVGHIVELSPALKQKSLFSDEIGNLEDRRVREVKIRVDKGMEDLIFGARVETVIYVKTPSN